jgi:hypothetical protein
VDFVRVAYACLAFVDAVSFFAAVAKWRYRGDVPAGEPPDRLLLAGLSVGAEALGFGVDAVVRELVADG